MDMMQSDPTGMYCYYCMEYQKLIEDYPVNFATHNEFNDQTPRCDVHFQYKCDVCGKNRHFNGISFCVTCKTYTCINCEEVKLERENFLIYSYYYNVFCNKCEKYSPTLDYAEMNISHPIQSGFLGPSNNLAIWVPFDGNYKSKIYTGKDRIHDFTYNQSFEDISGEEIDTGLVWDDIASTWIESRGDKGDLNHEEIIIPNLINLLEPRSGELILDIGCGDGIPTRRIAQLGSILIGIDASQNMLKKAIEIENSAKLGIEYIHLDGQNIASLSHSFDKAYANMSLMDIPNIETVISGLSNILKENGLFVFSISHPCFAWPALNTIRLPKDSMRGEDNTKVLVSYNSRVNAYQLSGFSRKLITYHRPISAYINILVKHGFMIEKMIEPMVSDELYQKYPIKFATRDSPDFLLIRARKKA